MAQYIINTKIYLYEVNSYLLDTISFNYICEYTKDQTWIVWTPESPKQTGHDTCTCKFVSDK